MPDEKAAACEAPQPVAWLICQQGSRDKILSAEEFTRLTMDCGRSTPLYAHPDQRIAEYRELLREAMETTTERPLYERIRAALEKP